MFHYYSTVVSSFADYYQHTVSAVYSFAIFGIVYCEPSGQKIGLHPLFEHVYWSMNKEISWVRHDSDAILRYDVLYLMSSDLR